MVCIYCGGSTQVINSRPRKRENSIWRRRVCEQCRGIFTTHETIDLATSILVRSSHKRNKLEKFSRDKLFMSIITCLNHRPTAITDAGALTDTVLLQILSKLENGTIQDHMIAKEVKQILSRFDSVAAALFEAYHPSPKEED